MDEYELDLLEAVENADTFKRIESFEDELLEAKQAARNFLNKTKNINIRIPEFAGTKSYQELNLKKLSLTH